MASESLHGELSSKYGRRGSVPPIEGGSLRVTSCDRLAGKLRKTYGQATDRAGGWRRLEARKAEVGHGD